MSTFYWWEDFISFNNRLPKKKTSANFGYKNKGKAGIRVVKWPSRKKLKKQVWLFSMRDLGTKYGVSDNAVRKWCRKYKVLIPPQGYHNFGPEKRKQIRKHFTKGS
jgi:hypothetical protein